MFELNKFLLLLLLLLLLEVQRYRSFHAKSGAILRFVLVLKIFHKVFFSYVLNCLNSVEPLKLIEIDKRKS